MRYILGGIGTLIGFMLIWKTTPVYNFTGQIEFAEKYLGTDGGTRLFIKIIGCVVIIVSWMYMLNMGESILRTLFLPGQQQQQY